MEVRQRQNGPDRRFKDNRQLPILSYGQVTLEAPNGLHAIWQFSRAEAAPELAQGLRAMTSPRSSRQASLGLRAVEGMTA